MPIGAAAWLATAAPGPMRPQLRRPRPARAAAARAGRGREGLASACTAGSPTRRLRYVARRFVIARGRVRPYVVGQVVTLQVVRKGKLSKRIRALVSRRGRFKFRFQVAATGRLRLVVKHAGTQQQAAFRAQDRRSASWCPGPPARARADAMCCSCSALSCELHFAVPVTGHYGCGTARAVLAFRKTNGWHARVARRAVYSMALQGRGAFKLRYPGEQGKPRGVRLVAPGAGPG